MNVCGDAYSFIFPPVVGPSSDKLADVLARGNNTGGTPILVDVGDAVEFDVGIATASMAASGPTMLLDNPAGQWRMRAPMTTAGAEVGFQLEDAAGLPVWRLISFAASDSVSAEWYSAGAFGNFRIGPDPLNPDMYLGVFAIEGDYIWNTDGLDPTNYINFYSGDRIAWGDAAGQDQELEVITTVIQLFESTGLTREMRWTPPALPSTPWVKTFGAGASGQAEAGAQAWTADITPPALPLGTTQNYAPAGLVSAQRIRQAVAIGGSTLGGLTGGADGRIVTIQNLSTAVADILTLSNENVGSVAANRFDFPGASSVVMPNGGSRTLIYDATSSRWKLLTE